MVRNLWLFHSACVDRSDKICAIFMISTSSRAGCTNCVILIENHDWLKPPLLSSPLSILNWTSPPPPHCRESGGGGGCRSEYCINDHSYNCTPSLSPSLSLSSLQIAVGLNLLPSLSVTGIGGIGLHPTPPSSQFDNTLHLSNSQLPSTLNECRIVLKSPNVINFRLDILQSWSPN